MVTLRVFAVTQQMVRERCMECEHENKGQSLSGPTTLSLLLIGLSMYPLNLHLRVLLFCVSFGQHAVSLGAVLCHLLSN
jgi:hypothetical protein